MADWDHMRIVLAIQRTGSMQAAAEKLAIDRTTVLRRLDVIEHLMKTRLFERRSDGCILTTAGKEVVSAAESMEETMHALGRKLGGAEAGAEGEVAVTVPEFFATTILIPALPRLRQAYPKISVDVLSGHKFLNLARGEADIALRNRRPEQNTLVSRKVGSVGIAFFATHHYLAARGIPRGDYSGHDVILFGKELSAMPGFERMEELAGRANIVMRANEILPLLSAAKAGMGLAAMPCIAAYKHDDLIAVWPGLVGQPEIFLLTHRDLRNQARIRVVYDFIVKLCTENAAALSGRVVAEAFPDHTA